MKSKDTSWGKMANWYDDMMEKNEDSFQAKVILPNLLRILDPRQGMTVFENACGQGYFARAIAEKGADVVASDISEELIARAKAHSSESQNIQYFATPADKLTFLKDATVDAVVIVLALQNIENLDGVISECKRVLKTGGRFIIVLNHPAFRIPKRSSWEWTNDVINSQKEIHYRRIDGYMSESKIEVDMTPGERDISKKKTTLSFHRPLQVYFKAFNKYGLAVTRLEEWISHKVSQKGPRADEEDRMRKEIPMFLCLEAIKMSKN